MTLEQINALSLQEFRDRLGSIFEHSPWVAERVWPQRPFAIVDRLHGAMCAAVAQAEHTEQLALIRAHPQLAGKAAVHGELTDASTREQRGAGLDQCSPAEFADITRLNDAYQEKYGFPFIIAVRGHTRLSIIEAMTTRLANTPDTEFAEALRQIERIAAFRLADMIET